MFRWEKGRPTSESITASTDSLQRSVSGKPSRFCDANLPGGASSSLATSGRKQGYPELSPCVWFPPHLFFALTVVTYRSQLIINTAIVYMHRFYMIHSFTKFHRNVSIAAPQHSDAMFPSGGWEAFSFLFSTPCLPPQIISQTTLFLAAKVEEQPRKLEHVIKIAHTCISPQDPAVDPKSNVSFAP